MRKFQLCILVILCLSCFMATAQNQKLISGNFTGYHFPQLVREIEKQTSYHIYYDSTDTDSPRISLNANELTIQQVFDAVFKSTDVHYAVAAGDNVFVSKRYSNSDNPTEEFL
ncbi:MAG: secretin and TonB N-terminal domain-containing protein [Puia sp.]